MQLMFQLGKKLLSKFMRQESQDIKYTNNRADNRIVPMIVNPCPHESIRNTSGGGSQELRSWIHWKDS
eukprot:6458288-Amphidinium_carterae.3